jgi:hypothetical protein
MRRSAFTVGRDEGRVHVEAYSLPSLWRAYGAGTVDVEKDTSEHGHDDRGLDAHGDRTHLDDR